MPPEPHFLRRFQQIRARFRRSRAALGLVATILVAAIALGFLASADYQYELPRATRAARLGAAVLATALACWHWLIAPWHRWTRPRIAAAIEGRFPELGQRVRTVVQYAGQPTEGMVAAGVKPSLVAALAAETAERANPLPLGRIAPWRRIVLLAAVAAVPIALLGVAAGQNAEWRIAIERTILIERPYTTVDLRPGDILVDRGADVLVVAAIKGRSRSVVTLQTRPVAPVDSPWRSEPLGATLRTTIGPVKEPLEYRIVAGPVVSAPHAIRVRYPLTLRGIDVEVRPPAYTGLEPRTIRGGDVRAVVGSVASFRVAIDAVPGAATLELRDPSLLAPLVLPMRREGDLFVATTELVRDVTYQVVARSDDGRVLPRNQHRIDVVADQPPRVAFDEPDETLEVHPIAEVRTRARVADDFGLDRAGIVYRFNDGAEQTLILRDFAPLAGKRPTTAATLEETLLVETLHATPRDSVTYYAFAEDNFLGGRRRTETDLRYIDFRPFQRRYKLAEPTDALSEGASFDLIALDELIARQRVNLNRAHRLAKRRPTDRPGADDPLGIASAEELLLNLTEEFTVGIEQLADERVDALHLATAAMQAAIDALDHADHAAAPPAMAEALKHLVAARRELITLIASNPALAQTIRTFDRRQAQKIRQPPTDEQATEPIADRLERLAQEADRLAATITKGQGGDPPQPPPHDARGGEPPSPRQQAAEPHGSPGRGNPARSAPDPDGGGVDVAARHGKLTSEVRDLEAQLKRLTAISPLARERVTRAAERAEQASTAWGQGHAQGAATAAGEAAGLLHELARQIRGELAPETADELGMARDLADELGRRAAELADRVANPARPGEAGVAGRGKEGEDTKGTRLGGNPSPSEAEPIQRLAEMVKTLEAWLNQIDRRGGNAGSGVRDLLNEGGIAEVVERAGRLGELRREGDPRALGREARELATRLEEMGQILGRLHQGIVAPELAALVEFDHRLADLTARLDRMTSEAELAAWKREAAALTRDLAHAGVAGADTMTDALRGGGGWRWDDDQQRFVAAAATEIAVHTVSVQLKTRVQDLILQDLASARDEATPPLFRELVERYYQVISRGVGAK